MHNSSFLNKPNALQMVVNSASNISLITTNHRGTITSFSRGSELLLGYTAEEIIGTDPIIFYDVHEIFALGQELGYKIDNSSQMAQFFMTEITNKKIAEREWTYIRKDGTRRTVSVTVNELCDEDGFCYGYLSAAIDISKKKKAEMALLQEKHFSDQLISSLPGIFYIYDANLHLKSWNINHEKALGYTSNELYDKYLGDFYATEEELDLVVKTSSQILESGTSDYSSVETNLRHKNGTMIPYLLTGVRIESPEGPMLAGVGLDLTQRKKLEEQLRQSQKMESIGQLAGGIAHDFNNIITTIMGNVELVSLTTKPTADSLEYLESIKRATRSASMLTRKLLAFSRKTIIAPKTVNLSLVLIGMQGMLASLLGENLEFKISHDPDLWQALIDPGQLDQIILNLAVNARDAMPNGGLLSVKTANVVLDESYKMRHPCSAPGEYVMLSISDTGTGMTPETLQRLFEPFYTTKTKGTGLGLATVFSAIKQNNGLIDVYSEQGLGTTFKIYLPRATDGTNDILQNNHHQERKGGTETIVFAEDAKCIRDIAERTLTSLGYNVLSCEDGKSALIASATCNVDLLVTDLIMPGMNGKELAEKMVERQSDLKVLYSSGYTSDIIGRHGMLEAGIELLPKPYSLSDLARKVRELLDRPSSH